MSQETKSVLIVEDDLIISMVLERKVKKMGLSVARTVLTGKEAIGAVEKLSPDLILMDIQLKGDIDGIEAMNRIRETSDVPVIYITGNSEIHNIKRAKETSYVEYLVKPIRMEDLEETINRALGKG